MEMRTMSDTDNYKLSFDYYLEYAVVEHEYRRTEQVFVSRDVNEAFRELLAAPDGVRRTLQLLLRDPEEKIVYYRVLASYGGEEPRLCQ
jgi:hypothetical protein